MKLAHLSWSQINMLHRCGEQYRRRYIERESLPPGIAAMRGRAVHQSIETNLIAKMDTGSALELEAVRQLASDAFDAAAQDPYVIDGEYLEMTVSDALGAAKDESVDLAGLHAKSFAPLIEPTAIEVRVEIPPSDSLPVKLVTILDLIDAETAIRDTKTSRKAPFKAAADQSDQLSAYDLAFRARYRREPTELSLDHLWRTPGGTLKTERQTTTRSSADLAVFVRRAQSAVRMIESEVFLPAPTDSWQCSTRFCGYASTCPYFRGLNRPTT